MDKLKEYWNNYNFNNGIDKNREIYKFFEKEKNKLSKNSKILEIGAGSGKWLYYWKDYDYSGIDYADKQVEICHKRGLTNVIQGDARDLPYEDNSFDFVYSLGVIEHFPETQKAIEEHYRVCKPGGTILITVLNKNCPKYLERLVGNIIHKRSFEEFMVSSGKRYGFNEFRKMCEKEGIKVDKVFGEGEIVSFPKIVNELFKGFEKYFGHNLWMVGGKG
ncbi:class I SAM-dependent methyltransferase [Haliovirga abyssi]|uniref:Methyltransferase type 11 domain-containing protein n=1 Tax=Haliovirga abyssi TaxID=2996794 RepID=A0AAU9DRD0_9FUSO|nr:class I SAM-dependent methyltransferase [Haliovirga abyssi]BDU51118.1 hypothetical protein HLVA_16870 [Haliovirga abyssi]